MTDSLDIFISYAEADAEWTRTWLLPRLEAQGLQVASANDLLAGGARIEQIAQEAENSKHTLLVLSPDWVTNQWEIFTGLISLSADPVGRRRKTIPLLRQRCEPPRSIARLVNADFTSEHPSDWEKELNRVFAVLSGQRSRTTLGPPLGALLGAEAPTNFKFPQNRHFVGRDQELAELHDLLDDAVPLGVNAARTTSSVAGLTGLGGVGKTQLVVEYIHRYGKSYPGGIFWINAADGVEDDFIDIGRIISGDGHDKKPDELIRMSFDYLRSDPDILLVVDNLNEPALLHQPVANTLTPISLPCRLLFTTRRRDLRGLRSIAVDMLTEADALKLLLRSRPAILEASHPEHPVAIKLCATLGGLPLAIEMAAAYFEQEADVTLSGYLKRLGRAGSLQTLDTLEQAKDWSPTWHDPIQITLQSQWNTLTDAKAHLLLQAAALMPEAAAIPLARLSLLTGLSALAEEGYPSPLAIALRHLHNYSLIEKLEGNQVRLHPLVREFVRTKITDMAVFSAQCVEKMANALEDMLRVNGEIAERGVDELLKDINFGLNLQSGNATLEALRLVVDKESHNLRKDFVREFPSYILQQIRKRAFDLNSDVLLHHAEAALDQLQVPWFREHFQQNKESRALLRTFEGHTDSVLDVAITPDGMYAVSASEDSTLRLWDLQSGECLRIFEGHRWYVNGLSISPDGKFVISASFDQKMRLWDLQRGECVRLFQKDTDFVIGTAFNPDGSYALPPDIHFFAVAITPDGRQAVSASTDGVLRLWDLQSGECLRTFEGHESAVIDVAVSPDGRHIISTSEDKTLRLWDLQSGKSLRIFDGHESAVHGIAISPDGRHIISASDDKTLRLWDLQSGECLRTFDGHTAGVSGVAISPDGRYIISASGDKTVRLWDLQGGEGRSTSEGHTDWILDVAISPDGRHVISASYDKTLRLWDLQSGKILRTFKEHETIVYDVAITPDGKYVISASDDTTLRLWDLQSGECLHIFEGAQGRARCVAISPDGKQAVSAHNRDTLRLWDLSGGECLRTVENKEIVTGLAITPDGRHVISASNDKTLRVWDLQSGECLRIFEGHTDWILDVAITPDGRQVISASDDRTLRLWDYQSGQAQLIFASEPFKCISTDATGSLIFAGGASGQLHFIEIVNRKNSNHENSQDAWKID